ncbi:hypothetical protein C8R45DRAFT_1090321 [Mycena sanguinolenta]|nr:hypothetical protein C8R45DRAFT_1090321 [Mycena sanguinolenta]
MLLDLSPDLLYDIGTQLASSDQKRLRSVCQGLNDVLQPLAFSHLVLKLTKEALCDDMLALISSGSTGWSQWATTLWILPGIHQYGRAAATVPATQAPVLKAALMSLGKLHTITWRIHMNDPDWTRDAICEFLNVAPGLRDLQLKMASYETTANIPLGIIRENRCTLTSLHLVRNEFSVEIWELLITDSSFKGLQLLELTTDVLILHLLVYLSSYSGLRRLNFIRAGAGTKKNPTNSQMYSSQLSSRFMKTHSSNSRVRRTTIVSGASDATNNTVHMLLSVVTRLESLSYLCIVGAGSERLRRATCGNPRMNHRSTVNSSIDAAVATFRTEVPSMGIVHAGRKWYTLCPIPIAGSATMELGNGQAPMSKDAATVLTYEEFDHPDSSNESYWDLFY